MTDEHITCAECDDLFPGYFEGELDDGRRAAVKSHATSCARCHGLIRDMESIRDQAAALPELSPSHDLWQGIKPRIQPAVVPITARREAMGLSRRILGLAAAALIVVSSSITYVATRSSNGDGKRPVRVVEVPRDIPRPVTRGETGTATPVTAPGIGRRQPGPTPSLASAKTMRPGESELALAPEIERLQQTLRQRKAQLEPATIQVVEDNLKVIDVAVKQARAALERDPASGFLTEQLDNVLRKKVQLLRTVALLPSRS